MCSAFSIARSRPESIASDGPAKEDAVLATGRVGFEAMLCEYDSGTQKGNPIEVVREIFSKHAEEHPEQLRMIAELVELERQNPTLKPFRAAQEVELSTTLSELIASRFDIDATQDPYPALTAAAIVSAITTSLSLWAKFGCSYDCLPELVDKSFNIAAAGYSVGDD